MIVVVGDIAVDIVSTLETPLARGSDAPAEISLMPGGSGANVAVWLARLGQRATFVGRIGDDMFGRWLRDDLVAEGVEAALVVDNARRTGVIQVLVEPDGERTMAPDRGANAVWAQDDISETLIAGADLLHVVGYVLLDRASQPGALTAMALCAQARRSDQPGSQLPCPSPEAWEQTRSGIWWGRWTCCCPTATRPKRYRAAENPKMRCWRCASMQARS